MGSWKAKYCSLLPCSAAGYKQKPGGMVALPTSSGARQPLKESPARPATILIIFPLQDPPVENKWTQLRAIFSADSTGSYISGGDFDAQDFWEGKQPWRQGCGGAGGRQQWGEAGRVVGTSAAFRVSFRPGLEDRSCHWRLCEITDCYAPLWSTASLCKMEMPRALTS